MNKKNITILIFCASVCIGSFGQEKNLALNKPVSANSENGMYPAKNMVDGKITRHSKWMSANVKPPHILEINLQKYCNINKVVLYTGIPELERTAAEASQAAGFWSAKNFKLQYWDDANWTDIPHTEVHENRLTTVPWSFSPAINTFKLRFICDDGEPISIMEIEVFGTETNNRPVAGAAIELQEKKEIPTDPQQATITVSNKVTGKTMKYVGYNQGYYLPGSNISGWVEYSNVNSYRLWASLNSFVPASAVQEDKNISSVNEFDKRKIELRQNPEKNKYIQWNQLLPIYDRPDSSSTNAMVFSYALKELKRLHVDVLLQLGSTDFEDNWENKWKQWQRYYAIAYYAAKTGDVSMYAMQNEPNHRNSGPMKLEQWIMGMQIVSDAIHAAVEDVNKKYGKKLTAKFVGPVTAGNNPEWWAAVAKNIRTDYHGNKIEKDLLEIFSTHSYNSPAAGYESRINAIRKTIMDNHPAGKPLPIVYTEIGRWMNAYLIDKEETMDSPSLFTEWAGIYSNNMKNGGYGMWAFKFANTASGPYPRGIKSGHHFTWQGKRIVEDAYKNIALGKQVIASSNGIEAAFITDGDKSANSLWQADTADIDRWAVINLDKNYELGSAVIYTGSPGGIYTAPDRIKNFKLQYWGDNNWKDIPGSIEKDNKYAQVFEIFKQPVKTDKVRFITSGKEDVIVREIKLFEKTDGPTAKASYDVSGIQRTGEVVRLFAKGFKDERPLLETISSVNDNGLDAFTSFDEKSGNYYMWLVQRSMFDYHLKIDLTKFNISVGSFITAETVSPDYYGEVTNLIQVADNKIIHFELPAQSVVLLTVPKTELIKKIVIASSDATVAGGKNSFLFNGLQKELTVQLDASQPEKNNVAYMWFDLSNVYFPDVHRVLLKVNGYTDKIESPFRLHVYGIPSGKWNQQKLNWNNAPLLDSKEALIKEVGQKAFVAGELAFTRQSEDHMLDVTDLIKKHIGKEVTFVLVRETRQLGDDEDKGRKAMIHSKESNNKPELIFWMQKK